MFINYLFSLLSGYFAESITEVAAAAVVVADVTAEEVDKGAIGDVLYRTIYRSPVLGFVVIGEHNAWNASLNWAWLTLLHCSVELIN